MLAISMKDYNLYGCPNCGCDTSIRGNVYDNSTIFGTCENCELKFAILADGVTRSTIGIQFGYNQMEYPRLIQHPRKGIIKWEYKWPDNKPEYGEYFWPRGLGYDLAGLVKSKEAGERILVMVKRVLNKDIIKTWLDFRPNEPKWIQVKFQPEEFDLGRMLPLLSGGILTEEILTECAKA